MKKCRTKQFFTLLEVMVSMGVFALLMLALMQFFSAAQSAWERSGGKAELFDSARIATQLLYNDLSASFYGDQYHVMGDAGDKYIFYKTGTADSKVHLTFAAMRGGTDGLTEVDYEWDPATLNLSVRELSESSVSAATLGADGWVNYPSNTWITNIRGADASTIAENILMFEVRNFYYNDSTPTATPPDDSVKYRPPALVFVTFAALSSAGYEKLELAMKAVNPSVSDSDIRSTARTFFTSMLKSGKTDEFADADEAIKLSGSDPEAYKGIAIPAKQILFDHVQFFKVMVPVNRE
ncbi:MAG: hypothetical protein IJS14_07235 [Lentisphaeria bacterium]|nr:hypothetical protein [Lentisphaeria bacterium]